MKKVVFYWVYAVLVCWWEILTAFMFPEAFLDRGYDCHCTCTSDLWQDNISLKEINGLREQRRLDLYVAVAELAVGD